jgi:hypothetical protein
MKLLRDNEPSGYERIRRFLLTQIAKAGAEPMRLASSRELAAEFGVTHTTVVRVLKELVADGYLSVKKGIGVFTTPRRDYGSGGAKTVALLFGDGKTTFMPRMHIQLSLNFADALLARSPRFQIQNCFLSSKLDKAPEEIKNLGFDGIMWFSPVPAALAAISRIKKEMGLAALIVNSRLEGVSSMHFESVDSFGTIKTMLSMGRRRILWIVPGDGRCDGMVGDFKRIIEDGGAFFSPDMILMDSNASRQDFPAILERLNPDAIIFSVSIIDYWKGVKAHLATARNCIFSSGEWTLFQDMEGYRGIVTRPLLKEAAAIGVSDLIAQLDGQAPAQPLDAFIESELETIGMELPS